MKILTLLFLLSSLIFAQTYSLEGFIYDSQSQAPLPNVNVKISNSSIGTASNESGYYRIANLPRGSYELIVTHIGYSSQKVNLEIEKNVVKYFYLTPSSELLEETIVEASRVTFRETPISFSQINSNEINQHLGSRDAMLILNNVPNVYASPQGGGLGDLRLNVRGFDQTNIGVMLNGVPLNNPENGEVYWSNYAGIAEVIGNIQVQRGLGASPYSTNSVGGLINIVTTGFQTRETGTIVKTETGSDQFRKLSVAISKPVNDYLSVTALLSRKSWDGYADQTSLNEFTYYLAVGSIIKNHSLMLQLIGSPQQHGQRITPSLINDYDKYGLSYNPDWGYLNGKPLSLRDNKFHKPSINLIHNWVINEDWNLSTVLYYTHGNGGGTVPPWTSFDRTENGLVDFQKEWAYNSNNIDSTYHNSLTRSVNPLRDVVHRHNWYGGISSASIRSGNFKYSFGVDGKYYTAQNFAKVGNLLGGDYYIGFANVNRDPTTLLTVGNKIDYNADSFARAAGGFTQAEYSTLRIDAFVNASVSNTSYKRIDKFNYSPSDKKYETDWESFFNYSIKSGINYKFNPEHNIYVNVGYFTKAPISFNVFDYSNNKYENVVNEKIFNAELGYGLSFTGIRWNVNTYFTTWKDQALSRTIQDENSGKYFFYNISGASARHMGIESDFLIKFNSNLSLDGSLSYAINKWSSDVNTTIAPESNPTQTEKINAYVDGLYVGNSPMTRAYFSLTYLFNLDGSKQISFSSSYYYFGRIFADYDPANRANITERNINSWQLPDYHLVDLHTTFNWNLQSELVETISVSFHIFNLFNSENIVYALDGSSHDSNSARVFYGRKRNWSLNFTFEF